MKCAKFQTAIYKTFDFMRPQSHRASQAPPPNNATSNYAPNNRVNGLQGNMLKIPILIDH